MQYICIFSECFGPKLIGKSLSEVLRSNLYLFVEELLDGTVELNCGKLMQY